MDTCYECVGFRDVLGNWHAPTPHLEYPWCERGNPNSYPSVTHMIEAGVWFSEVEFV